MPAINEAGGRTPIMARANHSPPITEARRPSKNLQYNYPGIMNLTPPANIPLLARSHTSIAVLLSSPALYRRKKPKQEKKSRSDS